MSETVQVIDEKHPFVFFKSLPKVDLHRHLEGSLRLTTLRELSREHELPFANTSILRDHVQISDDAPLTYENFLSKFRSLRLFYRSPEIIFRLTREVIEDAAADNIRYLELRFTPAALSRAGQIPLKDVIDWVVEATTKAEREYGILVRLIASINRHEEVSIGEEVARLSVERRSRGIIGLDLAGDEAGFSAQPFAGIFREARQSGLHITIHAGEWGGPQNIIEAILQIGAERIGHGVRVLEDSYAVSLAKERSIPFEVCVTSNYHSGVTALNEPHPIMAMLKKGLNVTINSDDPSISRITLSHEYQYITGHLGMSIPELYERILNSAQVSFLDSSHKLNLMKALRYPPA